MALLAATARVFFLLAAILAAPAAPRSPEAAAQGPDAQPTTRLVRSTSGTRGRQDGSRYVIEDPRSTFVPTTDRQIVVLFEWEAPAGTHHCEARWKDPSGTVVLTSPAEQKSSSRRFGIYWSIALAETVRRGLWAVEAFVDGAPAGTHVFEIKDDAAPSTGRRVLSQAEIYQRATASVGTVEGLGAAGEALGRGPAVALDADHVVTAFPSINGAKKLRLRTAIGTLESTEIGGWDRKNGWAVARFPRHGLAPLSRSARKISVGDQCFVLDSGQDESRVIGEAAVVGMEPAPASRLRLTSGFAAGSPALDDVGDLVGIVVAESARELGSASYRSAFVPLLLLHDDLLLSAERLPTAPAARVTLAELEARGEFIQPLSLEQRNIISGVFAGRVKRGGAVPMPQDQKVVYSRREGELSVFIQWDPQVKKDAVGRLDFYSSDGRLVVKGLPTKVKLRPGTLFFTTWTLAIDQLPPDVYRADLVLDDAPAWRGYVKVTE